MGVLTLKGSHPRHIERNDNLAVRCDISWQPLNHSAWGLRTGLVVGWSSTDVCTKRVPLR